jgi:hypothetical protein
MCRCDGEKRMRGRLLVAAAAALWAGGASAGQDVLWRSLTDATLNAELVGTVVEGFYSDGRHFTEDMQPSLKTFYEADDVTTDGTYWVAADRLCFSYTAPISTGCFEVWQRSKNCYDNYFMPAEGDPSSTLAQRMLGLAWDSRMWRTAEPSTCPAAAVADSRSVMLAAR